MQRVIFELNIAGAHPVKGVSCRCSSAAFRPPLRLDREADRVCLEQAAPYVGRPCPICSGEAQPFKTVTPKADALLAQAKAGLEKRKAEQRKKYEGDTFHDPA